MIRSASYLTALYLALLAAALLAQEGISEVAADEALLQEVVTLVQSEGAQQAIEFLEAHRKEVGLSPQSTSLLGALLVESGRGEEALALLQPLAEKERAAAALLFHTWRAAQQVGRGDELLSLLERAAAIDPSLNQAATLGRYRRPCRN